MTDANPKQPFLDMAERIARNAPDEFGGAMVLVPPEGEPITLSLFAKDKDVASFWTMAKAKIEIAFNILAESQRSGGRGYR